MPNYNMGRIDNIKRPWIVGSQPKRNKEHDPFYDSPSWRRLRKLKIVTDPLCEACKSVNIIKEGRPVDHIKTKQLFPEMALEYNNLMTLCDSHHAKKSRMEADVATREAWNKKFIDRDNILLILTDR